MPYDGPDSAKQNFSESVGASPASVACGVNPALAPTAARARSVLHVGNVANNGYSVSRLLRLQGVNSFAMSPDYYHIMGCPEWESGEMDRVPSDHFFPDWREVNLRAFERPRWFVQGPLAQCASYLDALESGVESEQHASWLRLETTRQMLCSRRLGLARNVIGRAKDIAKALPPPLEQSARRAWKGLVETSSWLVDQVIHRGKKAPAAPAPNQAWEAYWAHCAELVADFKRRWPDRADQLTMEELLPYFSEATTCARVMKRFDVVQAYGADVIRPMLANKRPYVAFEHGTLRDFTMGDCTLHRLTALAYARADHVFITNGDCLEFAKKLGIDRYSPMVHPVDESLYRSPRSDPGDLRQRFPADVLLYCPIRHDWAVKGTDVFIRMLPELRRQLGGRSFRLIFSPWGADVERSRALVRELKCEDVVEWQGPFHRLGFIRLVRACDVVLDQMILPCFGATAPEAIAAGTPVIMSYDPKSTDWIIDEPAPILTARTAEEAIASILKAIGPEFRESYRQTSWQWFLKHHSAQRLIDEHLRVYESVTGMPFRHTSTGSES